MITYTVVTGKTANDLCEGVDQMINEGFEAVGSHKVVVKHVQNRFSGTQLKDSVHTLEYSQTMKLKSH